MPTAVTSASAAGHSSRGGSSRGGSSSSRGGSSGDEADATDREHAATRVPATEQPQQSQQGMPLGDPGRGAASGAGSSSAQQPVGGAGSSGGVSSWLLERVLAPLGLWQTQRACLVMAQAATALCQVSICVVGF